MLKLRYGHADPREAGVGNIVNCGAAMYIAPVGIANAGDPDGAYAEALALTGAHQSSYGREAAGVLAAAVAEAMQPAATVETVVETALRLAKDGTRTAIEAVVAAEPELDGWRTGGLAALRDAFAPFDSVGDVYASPAQNARSRAGCTRSRSCRSRSACSSRPAATTPRPCSAGSTTAATRTRSRRWAARSPGRSAGATPCRASGSRRSPRRADRRRGGRPGDGGVAVEIFEKDAAGTTSARTRDGGADRRRGARVRITWVQPEDLVGHELRQAREEGKDVDAIEERWLAAGGARPPRARRLAGPRRARAPRLALDLLDELDALPRPLADDEPEGFDEILALGRPAPAVPPTATLGDRVAGAWLGRAAGCVLGKPVEGLPREGIRAIAEATGNWPVRGWFTAEGLAPRGERALALEPREPADEPRRDHRRRSRGRRPQLHVPRPDPARARGHGVRLARRREALAGLPTRRADLHRRARGRAQPARGVPPAGDRDAPQPVPGVDRRPPAGRCLRLGGCRRPRGGGPDGVGRTRA